MIEEISSEEELKKEIESYKKNSSEIEKLQKSIKETLDSISLKSKEEENRLKSIVQYMQNFDVTKVEADEWVATLETVPKYKYPSASYKDLWLEAMSKLNLATQKILKQFESAHLDTKRKETKPEFKISDIKENNILNKGINYILSKFKNLFYSIKNFNNVVKDLPKLELTENYHDSVASQIENNIEMIKKMLNKIENSWSKDDKIKYFKGIIELSKQTIKFF